MDSATNPSGWYPDESNSSLERWWNGISWGDQTRPSKPANSIPTVPMTTPRPVDPYAQSSATPPPSTPPREFHGPQRSRANPVGQTGLTLGLISLAFNVFCIPSILAIILGATGLNTARKLQASGARSTGLGWSIAGIVLGVIETVIYFANVAN
jgi:hypothetical protein